MRSLLPADRWTQIETLFQAGVDLSPLQREAFLNEQCHDDRQLREEVLSLWHHDTAEEPHLADAICASAASVLINDPPSCPNWVPIASIARSDAAAWRWCILRCARTARELIKVQAWLSLSLARGRQEKESVALALDAIDKARLLAGEAGAKAESWRELPRAYAAMAATYGALGNRREARNWYRAAVTEWEKLDAKGVSTPDSEPEIEEARRGASAIPLRK